MLLLWYGAVGGGWSACVLVNPTIVIIEIGGTQGFFSLVPEKNVGAGKQCRAVLAAAGCISSYLEKPAEGGKSGKISVTGAASLTGLTREARQRFGGRGKENCRKTE